MVELDLITCPAILHWMYLGHVVEQHNLHASNPPIHGLQSPVNLAWPCGRADMPSNPSMNIAWPCGRARPSYMPYNPPLDVAWPCGRASIIFMPSNPPIDLAWPCGRAIPNYMPSNPPLDLAWPILHWI